MADNRLAPQGLPGDVRFAGQHHNQAGRHIAGLDDVLAGSIGTGFGYPAHRWISAFTSPGNFGVEDRHLAGG
ncbi:hypothetical protein NKJ26_27535 [Mesorhizobium sp. M0152]|uniref:hypothetical protein n=1 Tax=Mesorhizobium sp. M0152 TaxID=2956898 RepID=UPI00333CD9DA